MPCVRAPPPPGASRSASVPSSGSTAVWPPSGPPIAQGLPGSPGWAMGELLRPLRWVRADRVDRRQVEHVEARARARPRQLRLATPAQAAQRAREELVPGARRGPARGRRPPRSDSERARSGRSGPRRRARPSPPATRAAAGAVRRPSPVARSASAAARSRPRGSAPLQAPGRGLEQRRALDQLAVEVLLPGGQLALDLVAPRARTRPPTTSTWKAWRPERARREARRASGPGVSCSIGSSTNAARPGRPVAHDGAQLLVAVADDVALHDHGVAEGALDGPAAALDDRPDVVDLDPRGLRAGRGCGHGRHSA